MSYRKKGGRKSSKRSKAAKKGWATRRRHGTAHKGHKAKKGHRKGGRKASRKAAGHKLVKFNRLAAKIGKRAAKAQVYGK